MHDDLNTLLPMNTDDDGHTTDDTERIFTVTPRSEPAGCLLFRIGVGVDRDKQEQVRLGRFRCCRSCGGLLPLCIRSVLREKRGETRCGCLAVGGLR